MALYEKNAVRDALDDDVYASADLSVRMPKYRFPQSEHDPRHAYSVVDKDRPMSLDSRARRFHHLESTAADGYILP